MCSATKYFFAAVRYFLVWRSHSVATLDSFYTLYFVFVFCTGYFFCNCAVFSRLEISFGGHFGFLPQTLLSQLSRFKRILDQFGGQIFHPNFSRNVAKLCKWICSNNHPTFSDIFGHKWTQTVGLMIMFVVSDKTAGGVYWRDKNPETLVLCPISIFEKHSRTLDSLPFGINAKFHWPIGSFLIVA